MKKNLVFFLSMLIVGAIALNAHAQVTLLNPLGDTTTFGDLIGLVTDAVAGLIASFAVIMFIYSGILFVFSAGRPDVITKAKNALQYAIVGTVIALAAAGLVGLIKQVLGAG